MCARVRVCVCGRGELGERINEWANVIGRRRLCTGYSMHKKSRTNTNDEVRVRVRVRVETKEWWIVPPPCQQRVHVYLRLLHRVPKPSKRKVDADGGHGAQTRPRIESLVPRAFTHSLTYSHPLLFLVIQYPVHDDGSSTRSSTHASFKDTLN